VVLSRAFDFGAADFIEKPLIRLETELRVQSVLSARAHYLNAIEQASIDPLTGLPNRTRICERIDGYLQQSHQKLVPSVSVAFVSMEGLKQIYDVNGYAHVDTCLIRFSNLLREYCENWSPAWVGYWGGEEFVVVWENLDAADIEYAAIPALLAWCTEPRNGQAASDLQRIGIGWVSVDDSYTHADQVARDAGAALHAARKQRKDGVRRYDKSLGEAIRRSYQIKRELQNTTDFEHFCVAYQPIFNIQNRQLAGFEALLRWNHPELGSISPNEFIPIAEQSNLILTMGEWVLNQVCRQSIQWRKEFPAVHLGGHVNLSRLQLADPKIVSTVDQLIKRYCIHPSCISLEITESMYMQDLERSKKHLSELRELGTHIAIDDFGTGYSSLSCLVDLPADSLKLDRSLIVHIDTDKRRRKMVDSVIRIAHDFGMAVVAEGVETSAQSEVLKSLNCDYVQGYLYGKPTDPELFSMQFINGLGINESSMQFESSLHGLSSIPNISLVSNNYAV
jgi:diguanylate cyclase (GGDEF)-like protein